MYVCAGVRVLVCPRDPAMCSEWKYHQQLNFSAYGVATISRLLKIIGLFCKRALQKRRYSTKETYNLNEPTNRSHPIVTEGLKY